jgi:hypothetical protein
MVEDITEKLQNLEEDGKQYAHFFCSPNHPGYYGIWIRERTPEYVKMWLPHSPLAGYTLAFSIEMHDATFCDYIAELYPEHLNVSFLKRLYLINGLTETGTQKLAHDFIAWNQEKTRLNRVKWLQQYPWLVSTTSR